VFFWVLTPYSDVVGYPEDEGSMVLRNVGYSKYKVGDGNVIEGAVR
jgi:hypothetical protein